MPHDAVGYQTMFNNEEFVFLTHHTVLLCTMPINSILCNTTTYDDLLYHKESYWNPFMGTKMCIYDAALCQTMPYYATYRRICIK